MVTKYTKYYMIRVVEVNLTVIKFGKCSSLSIFKHLSKLTKYGSTVLDESCIVIHMPSLSSASCSNEVTVFHCCTNREIDFLARLLCSLRFITKFFMEKRISVRLRKGNSNFTITFSLYIYPVIRSTSVKI